MSKYILSHWHTSRSYKTETPNKKYCRAVETSTKAKCQ